MQKTHWKYRKACALVLLLIVAVQFPVVCLASERNSLTLINHSGSNALVKLVGPSRRTVDIPNGSSKTVNIAGGNYKIYVRYGMTGHYRFTRGEAFSIDETAFSYTRASLTLHGVANGNYRTEGSSENEFNRQ